MKAAKKEAVRSMSCETEPSLGLMQIARWSALAPGGLPLSLLRVFSFYPLLAGLMPLLRRGQLCLAKFGVQVAGQPGLFALNFS